MRLRYSAQKCFPTPPSLLLIPIYRVNSALHACCTLAQEGLEMADPLVVDGDQLRLGKEEHLLHPQFRALNELLDKRKTWFRITIDLTRCR